MTDIDLIDKIEIIERRLIEDERGWLLKTITGKEKDLPQYTGEIYTVCGLPNHNRGGHYHKVATEWFTILKGEAELRLRDILTEQEFKMTLKFSDALTVKIPPFIAHQFDNNSENEFLLLAYSDTHYDPIDTIIYNL